jgi:light-harvesting protein B-800-850 alpha chain
MIYGKLWCVVKPSVGIPLFLSAVAVGSFAVHVALVTNTTWVKKFLNGNAPAAVAAAPAAAAPPTK